MLNFQSNVAIYGRRSEAPTITNYDWVHMITEEGDVKTLAKVFFKTIPNIFFNLKQKIGITRENVEYQYFLIFSDPSTAISQIISMPKI